jgi:prepilin-type processing-associated H-X9-DG protein
MRPTGKILLAEETTVNSAADDPQPGTYTSFPSDGRYTPTKNLLTVRHSKKADLGFVDGHVEAQPWTFGTNTYNSQASCPNNGLAAVSANWSSSSAITITISATNSGVAIGTPTTTVAFNSGLAGTYGFGYINGLTPAGSDTFTAVPGTANKSAFAVTIMCRLTPLVLSWKRALRCLCRQITLPFVGLAKARMPVISEKIGLMNLAFFT